MPRTASIGRGGQTCAWFLHFGPTTTTQHLVCPLQANDNMCVLCRVAPFTTLYCNNRTVSRGRKSIPRHQ